MCGLCAIILGHRTQREPNEVLGRGWLNGMKSWKQLQCCGDGEVDGIRFIIQVVLLCPLLDAPVRWTHLVREE